MDNLTHTLVGWSLAESGLKRRTALGTAALLVGANLPDLDAFIYLFGNNTDALAFRRGWTHGALAMVVLPLLLTAGMLLWSKGRGSSPERADGGVVLRWLLFSSAIGVWSHPLLDWLNTYGVRFLMPFSDRWFYGDALFIIDPWVWLALLVGIGWSRRTRRPGPARTALLAVAAYASIMAVSSRVGRAAVERQAAGPAAARVVVAPVPWTPFQRAVVRDLGAEYEEGVLIMGWPARYTRLRRTPTGFDRPEVKLAAATDAGQDFLSWSRFPLVRAIAVGDSVHLLLSDMRYGTGPSGSWATVEIRLPAAAGR